MSFLPFLNIGRQAYYIIEPYYASEMYHLPYRNWQKTNAVYEVLNVSVLGMGKELAWGIDFQHNRWSSPTTQNLPGKGKNTGCLIN